MCIHSYHTYTHNAYIGSYLTTCIFTRTPSYILACIHALYVRACIRTYCTYLHAYIHKCKHTCLQAYVYAYVGSTYIGVELRHVMSCISTCTYADLCVQDQDFGACTCLCTCKVERHRHVHAHTRMHACT